MKRRTSEIAMLYAMFAGMLAQGEKPEVTRTKEEKVKAERQRTGKHFIRRQIKNNETIR